MRDRMQQPQDSHDLVRATVLDALADGPVPLARVVARLEALAADDVFSAATIGARLQELDRAGRIRLVCQGRRWMVHAGGPAPSLRALDQPFLATMLRRVRAMVGAKGGGGRDDGPMIVLCTAQKTLAS